jgi:hypothetical protein
MNDLRCMKCGYDLHGLEFPENRERCPECGRITDLDFLAHDLVRHKRAARIADRELSVALAIMLLIMLSSVATGIAGGGIGEVTASLIALGAIITVVPTAIAIARRIWW